LYFLVEPQALYRNKNSNEILEKALTGEVIQLNEPAEVLSSSAINITWKILKSANLIEGLYLKYKPIGSKEYRVETITEIKRNSYVIQNLHKFTPYEILLEPFSGLISGSESNVVQAKTLDDIPSQSPINLIVEIDSLNSMSIKWQPPPINHMNGVINGYKISCLANETKYNINLNTNATTRAIIVGNLIEDMKYCIKVAAFTKKGTGPYTAPKCVEITSNNLFKLQTSPTDVFNQKETSLKPIISEPWFISLIVLISLIVIGLMFYCFWFIIKRRAIKQKKCKYMSTSSENGSLNVPHKIDNGNRYKLVNDTIWLDTLHSNSNQSNPDCCCVPDLHHQIFVQQNGANGNNIHLIHDLNCQAVEKQQQQQRMNNHSIKSKFAPINKINNNLADSNNLLSNTTTTTTTTTSSSGGGSAPQYAEIYGPTVQQLQQQMQSANPYATTGLFLHGNMNDSDSNINSNSSNPYNIINYQTVNNSSFRNIPNIIDANGNIKYSSYTIKMLADKMLANQTEAELAANQSTLLADQKKLLKYLQATQSQSNTPRVQVKNLQNRVKSVDNQQQQQQQQQHNCCFNNNSHTLAPGALQMQPPPPPQISIGTLPINQHQLINYLAEHNSDPITHEAIRNFLEMLPANQQQQQQQQQHQPSLPLAPPPSLASALIAQQQKQQQIIEGFNNFVASTISRTAQSPVHYNSPWNVNLDPNNSNSNSNQNAFLVNRIINSHQTVLAAPATTSSSNSSSVISNLTGNSTLSRGITRSSPHRNSNNNSSTFTAQQYANRTMNAKQQQMQLHLQLQQQQHQQQQQMQQDYSSISPEDDLNENDFKFNEYHQQLQQKQQHQINQRQNLDTKVQSWGSVVDTASSNPISSSYDSGNNPNSLSTSSNSCDLSSSKRSSRSDDDLNLSKQTNGNDEEKNKFIQTVIDPTKLSKTSAKHYLINESHQSDDIYLSEMVII